MGRPGFSFGLLDEAVQVDREVRAGGDVLGIQIARAVPRHDAPVDGPGHGRAGVGGDGGAVRGA